MNIRFIFTEEVPQTICADAPGCVVDNFDTFEDNFDTFVDKFDNFVDNFDENDVVDNFENRRTWLCCR